MFRRFAYQFAGPGDPEEGWGPGWTPPWMQGRPWHGHWHGHFGPRGPLHFALRRMRGPFGHFGPGGFFGHGEGERFFGRGDMKYALLALLRERPMYGYEMIKAHTWGAHAAVLAEHTSYRRVQRNARPRHVQKTRRGQSVRRDRAYGAAQNAAARVAQNGHANAHATACPASREASSLVPSPLRDRRDRQIDMQIVETFFLYPFLSLRYIKPSLRYIVITLNYNDISLIVKGACLQHRNVHGRLSWYT